MVERINGRRMIYFVFIALGILLVVVVSQAIVDINKLANVKKKRKK